MAADDAPGSPPIVIKRIGSRFNNAEREKKRLAGRRRFVRNQAKVDWAAAISQPGTDAHRHGFRLSSSQRGFPLLIYQRYRYRRDGVLKNSLREYWRCLRVNCRARMVISSTGDLLKSEGHSCGDPPPEEDDDDEDVVMF